MTPQQQAAFEALRERFVQGLTVRWLDLRAARSPADAVAGLHRLAGAAGSFGFESLGRRARDAEDCLAQPGAGAAARGSAWRALRAELLLTVPGASESQFPAHEEDTVS